jgi:hypothetical protein
MSIAAPVFKLVIYGLLEKKGIGRGNFGVNLCHFILCAHSLRI